MEIFKSAVCLIYQGRTLVKAAILVLAVALWLSVFYCSLFSDSTASVLSFLAVSSTVLMMKNQFCDFRKIDVIIIKIIELMSKYLILFGAVAILSNLWNTAFYSLCSGMFIKYTILKMRQSRANCAHLKLNSDIFSDYEISVVEVGVDEINQQDLVLSENVAIEQSLTNLNYNEGLNSANKSMKCHYSVLEDKTKLNKKCAVEIKNTVANQSEEVQNVLPNIPEALKKSSDRLEDNEIICVIQESPKEIFIEQDVVESCPKNFIECNGTEEAKELILHKATAISENFDLKYEDITNSEDKRLESSIIKMRHVQNNFDESIELDETNALERKENYILSDTFEKHDLSNVNKEAVQLNTQNEDNELSRCVKEIPKLKINILDINDIELNPNETNEQAEVRYGHINKSKNVNLIDDCSQNQPEKFSSKNEKTYEKMNNLQCVHNRNEMVKSNGETRTLEVQCSVQQERNELQNGLLENSKLSALRESACIAQNLGSESVNEHVLNTNVSSENNWNLEMENNYSSESKGLRAIFSRGIATEIHSEEMLQSAEPCHSGISRGDQSSLEESLQRNQSNAIKTNVDEKNVKQANESETEACVDAQNIRILPMDSNVENVVNRIDLSFIYAVC